MFRPCSVQDRDVGRASAEGMAGGSDDVVLPVEHMVFRNDGPSVTELTVIRRRDGDTWRDTLGLAPGDTITLPIPPGNGNVTVDVHSPNSMATTSFVPDERPPLFTRTDGAVLVARD